MQKRSVWLLGLILFVFLSACSSTPTEEPRMRLLSDVTLPPSTVEGQSVMVQSTPIDYTPEGLSPLQIATVEADFVIVTPTLPPSKTPTPTPTFTPTPTPSRTPTPTVTGTRTSPLLPTSEIIPITADVAKPIPRVCDSTWFFIRPAPDSCPLNPPLASQAVYQRFQNGHMIWVGNQDAIYVMYDDNVLPRWRVFRDYFEEGMVEEVTDFENPPASTLFQPRRGFGLLWRTDEVVRDRIGWALQEYEQPYSVQVQTSEEGVIFLSDPTEWVYSLFPGGRNWERYASFDFDDDDNRREEDEEREREDDAEATEETEDNSEITPEVDDTAAEA